MELVDIEEPCKKKKCLYYSKEYEDCVMANIATTCNDYIEVEGEDTTEDAES
jgi:hypothetical protein